MEYVNIDRNFNHQVKPLEKGVGKDFVVPGPQSAGPCSQKHTTFLIPCPRLALSCVLANAWPCCRPLFTTISSSFFKITLLKYNLHTKTPTHFKYTIQGFLVNSPSWTTDQHNPCKVSVYHSSVPIPSPGEPLLSIFCLYRLPFSGHFV